MIWCYWPKFLRMLLWKTWRNDIWMTIYLYPFITVSNTIFVMWSIHTGFKSWQTCQAQPNPIFHHIVTRQTWIISCWTSVTTILLWIFDPIFLYMLILKWFCDIYLLFLTGLSQIVRLSSRKINQILWKFISNKYDWALYSASN